MTTGLQASIGEAGSLTASASTVVTARVPNDDLERLRRRSEASGVKRGAMIRRALRAELDRLDAEENTR